MALFNFGRGKAPCCCGKLVKIQVLGTGCKTCHRQYENVKEAIRNLKLNAEAEYITDLEKIMTYGVMVMPALVIDGKVAASGKLLSVREVEKLLGG